MIYLRRQGKYYEVTSFIRREIFKEFVVSNLNHATPMLSHVLPKLKYSFIDVLQNRCF